MRRLVKGTAFAVILAVCCSCTASLFADTITLKRDSSINQQVTIRVDGASASSATLKYSYVYDVEEGKDSMFHVFCADEKTGVSDAFSDSDGSGQEYGVFGLADADAGFSDIQKGYIQSLYEHVYTSVIGAAQAKDGILIGAFQYCLWEIIHDTDMNSSTGTMRLTSGGDVKAYADTILSALTSDDWDGVKVGGYDLQDATEQKITVFVSPKDHASQKLISSDYKPDTGPSGTTPEPSTLAIFGLGLLGAGWAARRKKA